MYTEDLQSLAKRALRNHFGGSEVAPPDAIAAKGLNVPTGDISTYQAPDYFSIGYRFAFAVAEEVGKGGAPNLTHAIEEAKKSIALAQAESA